MKRLLILFVFLPYFLFPQTPQGVGYQGVATDAADEDLYQFTGEYIKSIDLGRYEKAIYFLEIQTDEGTINKKLILQ